MKRPKYNCTCGKTWHYEDLWLAPVRDATGLHYKAFCPDPGCQVLVIDKPKCPHTFTLVAFNWLKCEHCGTELERMGPINRYEYVPDHRRAEAEEIVAKMKLYDKEMAEVFNYGGEHITRADLVRRWQAEAVPINLQNAWIMDAEPIGVLVMMDEEPSATSATSAVKPAFNEG